MKKFILTIIKPLSFLPAILMMYLIFSFSAQSGEVSANLSYKVSYELVSTGNEIFHLGMDEGTISYRAEQIHPKVRKLAHMTEYFALAITISFPLYVYGLRGILLIILAGGICVGFACLDEYHQSFVAGRGPSSRDVAIDSIGAFVGILIVQIFCWVSLHLLPAKPKTKKNRKRRRF